jgi:hypothetical protein
MTNALTNATQLRAWANPAALGADSTGIIPADTYFAQAIAKRLPIRIPAGTFLLNKPISVVLAIGQDFVIVGEGPEVSRLVFGPDAVNGIAVTYSTILDGKQAQGDKTAVRINGFDIETRRAGGGSAISVINSAPTAQENETQVALDLDDVRMNGETDAAYWDAGLELQNVTFPNLEDIFIQDPFFRTDGILITSTGNYAAVDTTIRGYKSNGVKTALKIRGRTEGVYLSHLIAVNVKNGIDWEATLGPSGGKKPLLLMNSCHINTDGIAVKAKDVAQVIGTDSLIYLANSATQASIGFDFSTTNLATSENHQIAGVTFIGIGSPAGSLSRAVRIGTNVANCTIDAKIESMGIGIENLGSRNLVSQSTTFFNCPVRTTGFDGIGYSAEEGNNNNVDGTLRMELSSPSAYSRDQNREQLRAATYVFTAAGGGSEEVSITLERPFRTDVSVIVACLGEPTEADMRVFPKLVDSDKTTMKFTVRGAVAEAEYRLNYIAYGY